MEGRWEKEPESGLDQLELAAMVQVSDAGNSDAKE